MKTAAIIIPAHKAKYFIDHCVSSVRSQEIPTGWGIDLRIGVDGCEETAERLKRSGIPFYSSRENVGAYVMRNSLIAISPADCYILFDADDVMKPGYIAETLQAIESGHDFVITAKTNTDEFLRPVKDRLEEGGAFSFTPTVIEKIGGFAPYRCAADTDFMVRAKESRIEIHAINEPLYLRRKHPGALTKEKETKFGSDYRASAWAQMTSERAAGKLSIIPQVAALEKIVPEEIKLDPVYILIRTSGRPAYFYNCMASVIDQTYENIKTIVHSDNENDQYVHGDIVIHGTPDSNSTGKAPYNLYCNTLLKSIPDGVGWYQFLDDDDVLASPKVITKLVTSSKRDHINVGLVMRWNHELFPKEWGTARSFQTECFFLHTDHKDKATWWDNRGGDHYYSGQIVGTIPTNWIDNLVIAKAQKGKGYGKRHDLGEIQELLKSDPRVFNSRYAGDQKNQELVYVQYLKTIKIPTFLRGHEGDVKMMEVNRAQRLEAKGKLRIMNIAEINAMNQAEAVIQ